MCVSVPYVNGTAYLVIPSIPSYQVMRHHISCPVCNATADLVGDHAILWYRIWCGGIQSIYAMLREVSDRMYPEAHGISGGMDTT